MKRQFFSGNTLDQAVMQAARHFGIDPDRVAYSQREKKHGFLKVRRRVVIEVDSAAPEVAPDEQGPETHVEASVREIESAPTFSGEEIEDFDTDQEVVIKDEEVQFKTTPLSETASVERAVREILRFVKVQADVTVVRGPDVFVVEISDPDRDDLLDREGRILQAMEYLVPRLVRNWMGQGVPVKIDCEGFRAEREEKLDQLAKEVGDQVRHDGCSRSLDPMSPADRRLIHLALADDPDVFTESDGDGFFKCVRIFAEDDLYGDEDDGYLEDDAKVVTTRGFAAEDVVTKDVAAEGVAVADEIDDDEYEGDEDYDDDEYDEDYEYEDDEDYEEEGAAGSRESPETGR